MYLRKGFDAEQFLTALLERVEEATRDSRHLVLAAQAEGVIAHQQLRFRYHRLQEFEPVRGMFYSGDVVDRALGPMDSVSEG